MEIIMKGSIKKVTGKDLENMVGQMGIYILVNGIQIKWKDLENISNKMDITKVNSRKI